MANSQSTSTAVTSPNPPNTLPPPTPLTNNPQVSPYSWFGFTNTLKFRPLLAAHNIEVDILPDGRLDFEDAILERFDIVLASLHNHAGQDADRLTRRSIAAIRHPLVNVLCHPANRLVGHYDGYDLDFGAGIALGYATCGEVGFEGRSDYAAIGAVTNLASRLADEATGGQILIEQRLYAEVEDDIEVEPVGEFTLNGFQRQVAAFNVVVVREVAAALSQS